MKQRLRRFFIPPRMLSDLEGMRVTQGRLLAELNRSKPFTRLRDFEFGIFSQWGEDGIIQKLIREVTIANDTFIEFGVEDFFESNCRFLMTNDNWRGFVLDGSQKGITALNSASWIWKYDLRSKCAMITAENINALLLESGFDRDLGLLSIDVDGMDYWLLNAITAYSPRILIVEFNSLFGSERNIVVPYDAAFSRRQKHYSDLYYGASLGALAHLAVSKGYSLIGTESAGVNAFFVRNDVLGALTPLSVKQAFHASRFRQSRNAEGQLDFQSRENGLALIKGLPVINVETGKTEQL